MKGNEGKFLSEHTTLISMIQEENSPRAGHRYERFGKNTSLPAGKYDALGIASPHEVFKRSSTDMIMRL